MVEEKIWSLEASIAMKYTQVSFFSVLFAEELWNNQTKLQTLNIINIIRWYNAPI